MTKGLALTSISLLLAACSSGPAPEEMTGRGLVTVDEAPPDGTRIWNRPELSVGDRFSYRRGGLVQVTFRVVEAGEGGYELEEETTGLRNTFTRDLAVRGQSMATDASMDRTLEPFDAQLTWPLWVGKRWVCHFVRRGGPVELPIIARYECDALETIDTPAGSFECLRVWRRTQPAVDGEFFEKNDLLWFSPEVGFFARKLEDGLLTELQEFDRQGS